MSKGLPMESPKSEHFIAAASRAPAWLAFVSKWINFSVMDLGGGPRLWTAKAIVHFLGVFRILLFGFWVWHYKNNSMAVWILFAFTFNSGYAWFIKSVYFPDASYEHRITLLGSFSFFFQSALYSLGPWLLISGTSQPNYPLPDAYWLSLCVFINTTGSVLMCAADAQKYFTLRLKSGLITDGLFKHIRHPNYLGQGLFYIAYGMLAWHWAYTGLLLFVFIALFGTNMAMKEASMSRFPEWAEYKKKTWWLIPGVL
jgi:protein-S-isoprenylcysteine O-methyltransferase Ste14